MSTRRFAFVFARGLAACLAGCLAIGILGGCGGPTKMYLQGIKPLNVNDQGESTPVDVRVYILRDSGRFSRALYEDLWVSDKDVLGQDWIVEPRVYTVFPGEPDDPPQEIVLGTLEGDAQFIGIMALYGKRAADARDPRLVLSTKMANGAVLRFTEYEVVRE